MSLIIADVNIDKFYFSNKILINQLLKKFTSIYILNLYNLKIFTKKEPIKLNGNLPKEINIIDFKN